MGDPRFLTELEKGTHGLTMRMDRMLADEQTPYQHITIFENEALGRVMLLDGAIMLTQFHEFTYHEMLVHPALLAHPNPKRVLVVGGGDGGTLREVVKHPEVEEAVLCEIDQVVIDLSREHLPFVACGLDAPKATLFVGDGLEYIRDHEGEFDVVIVDSTDPKGFAEGLFRAPFYRDVLRAMKPGGLFVQQTESPFYTDCDWALPFNELRAVFKNVHPYAAFIPMYPSGLWTFSICSPTLDPWSQFSAERAAMLEGLRYYQPQMQTSAFVLPKFAQDILDNLPEIPKP
jgi:spermidine synthase